MTSSSPAFGQPFDGLLDRLEATWLSGTTPPIENYLSLSADPEYLHLLVAMDLEYRWRRFPNTPLVSEDTDDAKFPLCPRIEDYARIGESVREHILTVPNFAEEYRVRHRWGDKPSLAEYESRITQNFAEFTLITSKIDQALRSEVAPTSTVSHSTFSSTFDGTICFTPPVSATESSPSYSADRIGKYRVIHRLGRGGFGEVFLAEHPHLHRKVAIKIPRMDRRHSKGFLETFLNEGKKLVALSQIPGIVRVLDADVDRGIPYIVSDFIEGETLEQWRNGRSVTSEESARLVASLARSLHQAHLCGLTHRDVKPENVLLDKHQQPHLADFGLAISEQEQLAESPGMLGTIWYMSPEQARGESHLVDGRTDIYSLGVILYRLLTDRLPFLADTAPDYLAQINSKEPRPPRAIDDQIPIELERICLKCLKKPISERYSTAADLAHDLESWNKSVQSPKFPRRQRIGLLSGIGLVAGVVLLVGVLHYLRSLPERPPIEPSDQVESSARNIHVSLDATKTEEAEKSAKNESLSQPEMPAWARGISTINWPGKLGKGSSVWNNELKRLVVTSNEICLVKFGELPQEPFTLAVELEQPEWKGHVGIFFGYRELDVQGKTYPTFQLLHLVRVPNQDGKVVYRWRRRHAQIIPGNRWLVTQITPPGKQFRHHEHEHIIPDPKPMEYGTLTLNFDSHNITTLFWNETPLHQLVTPQAYNEFTKEEFEGAWGLMVDGSLWVKQVSLTTQD